MREGTAALGVWLPLAFARLVQVLEAQWGGKPQRTSAVLDSFALPFLAEAARKDEARADAEEMLEGFEALKKRFGTNGK